MKKGVPKSTPSSKFNAAAYVRPGLSEAEVVEIKHAFDLFDTDQGGSVDLKGIFYSLLRTQSSYGFIRLLGQKLDYFPNDCRSRC